MQKAPVVSRFPCPSVVPTRDRRGRMQHEPRGPADATLRALLWVLVEAGGRLDARRVRDARRNRGRVVLRRGGRTWRGFRTDPVYHPSSMAEALIVDPRESGRRHQRFADVETGLLGLFHFYRAYGQLLQGRTLHPVRASRWYYSALMMHADMLFTVDRGGSTGWSRASCPS
jgi:hypothetical protein